MRVPYGPMRTDAVTQIPNSLTTIHSAATALTQFLKSSKSGTALLTGAGISVPSGIPDYRGTSGTYIINKTYRPIFFNEFRERHASRQRYWARSFLGYPPVAAASPNIIHETVARLMDRGTVRSLVTQNVDGLHTLRRPDLKDRTTELHGSLHHVVCLTCRASTSRVEVQERMKVLNPAWTRILEESRGGSRELKTNPDGDVDLPKSSGVSYESFRYPACTTCLSRYPSSSSSPSDASDRDSSPFVSIDDDGAWVSGTAGILKPSVVFFGESVPSINRDASDASLDHADRLLCVGTSLAVYSAFRFIKAARAQGMPIAIVNEGHVRDEEKWISEELGDVRINMGAEKVLPLVLEMLEGRKS